jgi:hypothetical protein
LPRLGSFEFFSARPWLSGALAVVFALLGFSFAAGWLPQEEASAVTRGEGVAMAVASGVIAGYFATCARTGFFTSPGRGRDRAKRG